MRIKQQWQRIIFLPPPSGMIHQLTATESRHGKLPRWWEVTADVSLRAPIDLSHSSLWLFVTISVGLSVLGFGLLFFLWLQDQMIRWICKVMHSWDREAVRVPIVKLTMLPWPSICHSFLNDDTCHLDGFSENVWLSRTNMLTSFTQFYVHFMGLTKTQIDLHKCIFFTLYIHQHLRKLHEVIF